MQCPDCSTENRIGAAFCGRCGRSLALVCQRCGAQLPVHLRFCDACGSPLVASSPQDVPERESIAVQALRRLAPTPYAERLLAARGEMNGERRLVTILMSDVEGSSAMARCLDPEEWLEVMDGAFDVLIEPIARYGGTVARLEGDAIMALFGAPIAHEDDPERACRAGLEIVEGAKSYAARLEEERGIEGFAVRVGIHTGLVVVGEVGSDLRMEYTAMGEVPNLTARLESAAEPGTVLVSAETHRYIAPLFETEVLAPIAAKAWEEPVPVYRVMAAREAQPKVRGIEGLESLLVGRDSEFAALREAIDRLQAGQGGIVTIVGDAGIGKSRLVAELRKEIISEALEPSQGLAAPQWLEGLCLSYGTSMAYLPWLDVLHSALDVTTEEAPQAVSDSLRERLVSLCPHELDDVYAYLARLMSLPLEEKIESFLGQLDGQLLRQRTFAAVESVVLCIAEQNPLVLVLEDLHWADATSLALLDHLLPLIERVPLLIVAVFRPHKDHGSWGLRATGAQQYADRHTDLHLEPLTSPNSEALVGNLLRVGALPEELAARILGRAEGNPFYVEEIIRSLLDDGTIEQDEETDGWCVTREVDQIAIPDTLQGVLLARIDRLQDDTKRVLQLASVIGRIFLYRLLAAIAEEESRLDAHLVTLQWQEMIRERARVPELEYIFKHDLTREAAYNGLLRRQRRVFHRQVAEAIEHLFPERIDEQVELLAYHWEQAEETEKAIKYLLRAGMRSRRLGASLQAVGFYQLALRKAVDLDALEGAIQLYRIHEQLGDVYLLNLSRHEEALEHYAMFFTHAESEEDKARGARKVAWVHSLRGDLTEAQSYYETALAKLSPRPPVAETSRVHSGLAYLHISRNRWGEAAAHARAGLENSQQIGDTRGLADAYRLMSIVADHCGEPEEDREYSERSLELYRELGDLPRTAQACNNVGHSYRRLGRMDRSLQYLSEGLELARRIGNTRDEANILVTTAEVFLDQGRWEDAISHLEQALPLAQESGVITRIIEVHRILGVGYEGVGELEDARRHLAMAETLSRDTQHLRFTPEIYLDLARLNATEGEFEEAWKYVQLSQEYAGPEPPDVLLGLMHRCRGHLHSQRRNWTEAVAHLEKSLRLLEPASLAAEVAKTSLSLATAYARRNAEDDGGRACEHLLAARSIFRRIEATGYLTEIEARLEELGCRV